METAVQLDLFDFLAADLDPAERQQADWEAWLQDAAGHWQCPACGDHEPTPQAMHDLHGWTIDLTAIGHPFFYSWPGRYEEGGHIGNGGRCRKLRMEWLRAKHPSRPEDYSQ